MIERIVLNIPHSSDSFPYGLDRWDGDIQKHIDRWTDRYTDWLFATAALKDTRSHPVIFPWSRFFCDVERLPRDPLEKKGQGIVYTDFGDCHRRIGIDGIKRILKECYDAHMAALRGELTERSFLIDCHSFPADLSEEVDVCIGLNRDWSAPEKAFIREVLEMFSSHGYSTRINNPYSNSISPRMKFSYPSMMVELNKRTYLDESGGLDMQGALEMRDTIAELYSMILDSRSNLRNLYLAEFPLLYANRDRIVSNPSMVSVKTGETIYMVGDVRLGEYLSAIDARPDLFLKDGMALTAFSGSPMTGSTSNLFVDVITGKRHHERGVGFGAKMKTVSECKSRFNLSGPPALALQEVIAELRR